MSAASHNSLKTLKTHVKTQQGYTFTHYLAKCTLRHSEWLFCSRGEVYLVELLPGAAQTLNKSVKYVLPRSPTPCE